jgi:hypothetical protein
MTPNAASMNCKRTVLPAAPVQRPNAERLALGPTGEPFPIAVSGSTHDPTGQGA